MSTNDDLETNIEPTVPFEDPAPASGAVEPATAGKRKAPTPRGQRAGRPVAKAQKPSSSKGKASRRIPGTATEKTGYGDGLPATAEGDPKADNLSEPVGDGSTVRRSRTSRSEGSRKPRVVNRPRLLIRFNQEIQGALVRDFGYGSPMEAPRLAKIVLNMGLGEALTNAKALEAAVAQIGMITGQKAVVTKAKRSVAGFKLREGQSIGCMVTLRGRRMYEFLDRLINTAMPRIRDFRGSPRNSFDGKGNYSMGIREQTIFPEIDYTSVDRVRGLQISMVTTANSDREGFRLLELMGIPFARDNQS
jgi:large subunit ribosomal protein L5